MDSSLEAGNQLDCEKQASFSVGVKGEGGKVFRPLFISVQAVVSPGWNPAAKFKIYIQFSRDPS